MHPIPTPKPFSHPDWIFEPKWDGYRSLCIVENGKVKLISRNGRDLSKRFPELKTIHQALKASSVVLDGEIVALDRHGMPCFKYLQTRQKCFITYFVFDLLELNGQDLRNRPLLARKDALQRILNESPRLRDTVYVVEEGERLFKAIEKKGLEGMVCKRADSLYVGGKTKHWLKVKTEAGKKEMKIRSETWGHK